MDTGSGLTGSARQLVNPSSKELYNDMNESLEKFATSSKTNYRGRVSFVDFLFTYAIDDSNGIPMGCFYHPRISSFGRRVVQTREEDFG